MFWLCGEGLFEDVAPDDFRRSLETDPGRLEERLEQLVQEGYLDPSSRDGGRYRLNALGIEEGRRRFVDEFSPFLGRESHMETAARCKVMAEELGIPHILVVPNKVREPRDAEAMCSFFAHVGLPFTVFIPADEMILEADRLGWVPLDHDATSPAIEEIVRLADACVVPEAAKFICATRL